MVHRQECTGWPENKGSRWTSKCCTCSESWFILDIEQAFGEDGKEVARKVNKDLSPRTQGRETNTF